MDNKDLLKNMLDDFINGNSDSARQNFHLFVNNKSKDVLGIKSTSTEDAASEITTDVSSETSSEDLSKTD